MCKFWVSIVFGLLAIIISIISIAVSLPRVELGFDYLGVIVAMLTFLVTFLAGWNIYSIIDLKGLKKKYKELEREAESNNNYMHNKVDYNSGLSMCYNAIGLAGLLSDARKEVTKLQMLLQGAGGLKVLSNLQEFKMCSSVVSSITSAIDASKNLPLEEIEVNEAVGLFKEIPNMDKIEGLLELINKVKQ